MHHRRQIEFTFLSPLLVFEVLSLIFWLVGMAGVAQWTNKCTTDMAVVAPFYQPSVTRYPGGNTSAVPEAVLTPPRSKYEPSYEWFIVWSSFFSAVYMLYVTVARSSLWQHACAMYFCILTTGISITHCYYISYLVPLTTSLVYNKDAHNAVKALYAGLIGWSLMNICAVFWMCLDIDHDIAMDKAAEQLALQHDRSRAASRASTATPAFMYVPDGGRMAPAAAWAAAPVTRAPPLTSAHDEVDVILDEVIAASGEASQRGGQANTRVMAEGSQGSLY